MKKANKRKYKFFKILFLSLFILASTLFISLMIILRTEKGQFKSAQLISNFFSKKIETRITIQSAKFSFSDVTLNNIKIFDHEDSIMIYCPDAKIVYKNFRQSPGKLKFHLLTFNQTYVNFVRHSRDQLFNFQYVIEKIKNRKKGGNNQIIIFDDIIVTNSVMRYYEPPNKEIKGKTDYQDLYLMNVNVKLSEFIVDGQRVESSIDSANFMDKSGLVLNQLNGKLLIDSNEFSFNDISFFPGESEFYGDFGFHFPAYNAFKDFVNLVTIKSDLHDSRLKITDLEYFSGSLRTHEKDIFIDGEAEGTVTDMRSKHIILKFGKGSAYSGAVRMTGLPDINETLLDFDVKNLDISFRDIHSLIPSIDFPDYFYESGMLTFIGRYTGFINDFVAYGNLYTPFGEIESDINLKIPAKSGKPKYSGNLSLISFSLGQFTGQEELLGKVNMDGHISGEGLSLEDIQANIKANASYIDFNKYRYSDLSLNGILTNKQFKGGVLVNDKNLAMDFNGTIDLSQAKPLYNFKADIKNTDLHELNFLTDKMLLSCMIEINIQANNLDDAEGRILMLDADLETKDEQYKINTLLVEADYNYGLKDIQLKSELADVNLNGNFNFKTLPDLFMKVISSYFDKSLFPQHLSFEGNEFLSFDVQLHQTSFINNLLKSNIFFDDNSRVKGDINCVDNEVKLIASVPGFRVKDIYLSKLFINASKDQDNLIVYSSFGQVTTKDSVVAENLNVSASCDPDKIDFNLYFYDSKYQNHLTLNGDMALKRDSIELVLTNSYFLNKNNLIWDISSGAIAINYDPLTSIRIPSLELTHNDYKIKAYGTISQKGDLPLRVIVENTNFSFFQPYIPADLSDFNGILNGQLVIYDLLGNAYFDAAFLSNPLYYRDKELGMLSLSSNYNSKTTHTNINGSLYSFEMEDIMEINGYVDLVDDRNIDLTVDIPQSELYYFEPFMNGLVTDLTGEINAELRFAGPLDDYKVDGRANFYNTAFKVDYTQVRYKLTDDFIKIDEKGIYLDRISIKDPFGSSGLCFGEVKHDNFRNFKLGIGILAQNLHGIHTTVNDNSIFYGDAFVTGRLDILGPLDDIKMNMKLKSEKNTDIKLIAYDDNSFSNYNFIRFTNVNTQSRPVYVEGSTGISLDMDMEVTPDADVQIIFDPETNDIISANGAGDLKLQVDALGNVNMFGKYTIEKGEYTFVALDLLKRKFTVKKGSSITWMGDPFEAEANIEAIYKLDASVYNLIRDNESLTEEEKNVYGQATFPVEAKLLLTESLYAPEINLDFEILSSSSISGAQQNIILDQQVRNIKSDVQELNKQVISLLILNGFLPPETGIVSESAFENSLNANVSSLFSTQISQWLSGISSQLGSKYIENFQFGLNYVAENNQYQRELDLILSGSLLNDRIELSGTYDVENVNADFQVNYQPLKDRKLRLKVFSRTDNNPIYQEDINRQGIGIYVKEEFDKWGELVQRKKKKNLGN
ncbi:MAG: translocation/assembly module TamB domain-containing protein [Bacteroidetes bacterium]|nr:translocation/assembly module TamB domain-containing protein [Bacteroidota bacterium]